MIKNLIRKQVKKMGEINWGDVPDTSGMRLLWGENQSVLPIYKKAILEEINKINLYPSPTKQQLKEKLAQYVGVNSENIVPTNGSDEALELIAKVFIAEKDEVVMPNPSYPCFESVSQMMGATVKTVSLEEDFSLDIQKFQNAITTKTKIVWIANPNNPTGNILLQPNEIESLAKNNNCLFVIDECYFELSKVSVASLVMLYPNIIVTRSFSKVFALAGVRLGYIIANAEVTTYLNRLEQTNQVFNINRFALACGITVLSNREKIPQMLDVYVKLKKEFEEKLQTITTLEIIPTKTTFCLIRIKKATITAKFLKEKLSKDGIFIKDCSIYKGLGANYMYLGVPAKKVQNIVVKKIKGNIGEK